MATANLVNRRDFLKTTAWAGAGLVIGFHLGPSSAAASAVDQEKKTVNPFNAWVRITPDNQVTLILGKSEMGQGIMTALPMILAEELYLEWEKVKIEQAPTDPAIYDHGTGGSGSVAASWLPLRQAGAAAREMLITAAAQHWNVNRNTCKPKDGGIVHGARKQYLTYGELVSVAATLPVPNLNTVPLKNSNDFTIVGHDRNRFEARAKSTGTAKFGIDSRPDKNLIYAVIARCPTSGGKPSEIRPCKSQSNPRCSRSNLDRCRPSRRFQRRRCCRPRRQFLGRNAGTPRARHSHWDEGPATRANRRNRCVSNLSTTRPSPAKSFATMATPMPRSAQYRPARKSTSFTNFRLPRTLAWNQ